MTRRSIHIGLGVQIGIRTGAENISTSIAKECTRGCVLATENRRKLAQRVLAGEITNSEAAIKHVEWLGRCGMGHLSQEEINGLPGHRRAILTAAPTKVTYTEECSNARLNAEADFDASATEGDGEATAGIID